MKASFPRGGDRGKKRERARCSIVRRSVYTEKCTHALFARADTPPFPPFPEVHGGVENDREKEERKRARSELQEGGAIAGENGCARLRWRSEGRWEEGKDRGEVVTPGWPVYVSGIRRAGLLSSFLSSLARSLFHPLKTAVAAVAVARLLFYAFRLFQDLSLPLPR